MAESITEKVIQAPPRTSAILEVLERYPAEVEAVEELIANGVDLGVRDDQKRTPLHLAAENASSRSSDDDYYQILEILITAVVKHEHQRMAFLSGSHDRLGEKSAICTAFYGSELFDGHLVPLIFSFLPGSNLSLNAQDSNGDTPLHVGMCARYLSVDAAIKVYELFAAHGGDVNRKNSKGQTSTHGLFNNVIAAMLILSPIIEPIQRIVKKYRCDLNVIDNDQLTPFDYTIRRWINNKRYKDDYLSFILLLTRLGMSITPMVKNFLDADQFKQSPQSLVLVASIHGHAKEATINQSESKKHAVDLALLSTGAPHSINAIKRKREAEPAAKVADSDQKKSKKDKENSDVPVSSIRTGYTLKAPTLMNTTKMLTIPDIPFRTPIYNSPKTPEAKGKTSLDIVSYARKITLYGRSVSIAKKCPIKLKNKAKKSKASKAWSKISF